MINAEAAAILYQITLQGNATNAGFPVLGHDLRICSTVPHRLKADSCPVFWDGIPGTENAWDLAPLSTNMSGTIPLESPSISSSSSSSSSASSPFPVPTRTITVFALPSTTSSSTTTNAPVSVVAQASGRVGLGGDIDLDKRSALGGVNIQSSQVNGTDVVTVNGAGFRKPVVLERSCIWALNYPVFVLSNTKREDIVFVAFQFWVLGMSTVALLNESIPHIIASLLTHVLATSWAGFQIVHTADFREKFTRLTTEGACKPMNLLPFYWQQRHSAELPSLIMNIVALFVSSFLTWKLVKLFGWQTFKRVGASLTIHRIYKTMLVLSITLQLSLFFMAVTTALWIDQLYNGSIGRLARKGQLYKVLFTITLILLIPWLMTGWFGVRRESKVPMMTFLVLSIGYLAGLGVMFLSDTFRWTFLEWRFFSFVALASFILTVVAFTLGVVCRFNFGKGLPNYLNAEEPLPGDDFEPAYPSDIEKVEFPSNDNVIPTFSAANTSHTTVRNDSWKAKQAKPVSGRPTAHVRLPSDESLHSQHDSSVEQAPVNNSDSHTHSRTNSQGSQTSTNQSPTKRWVIE